MASEKTNREFAQLPRVNSLGIRLGEVGLSFDLTPGIVGDSIELTPQQRGQYQEEMANAVIPGVEAYIGTVGAKPVAEERSLIQKQMGKLKNKAGEVFRSSLLESRRKAGVATPQERAYLLVKPYRDAGKDYKGANPEQRDLWEQYLEADEKTKDVFEKQYAFIRTLKKRQAKEKERLRRTPEIDLALVRWYGYQGMTAAGKRLYKELYEGGQPTTPVTQPAAPTGATPSPRLKRLREVLAAR